MAAESQGKGVEAAVTIEALQDARSRLVQMLALLDPAAAAQYIQSANAQGTIPSDLSNALLQDGSPGLIHTLPALLAPILQPIQAQQQAAASAAAANANAAVQQQQPGTVKPPLQQGPPALLSNAIRNALKKSADLSSLATRGPQSAKDAGAERKLAESEPKDKPSLPPALQLSVQVLSKALVERKERVPSSTDTNSVLASAVGAQDANPLLILRKRRREAEQSNRAARRRRVTDTIRFLNFSIQPNTQASQLPDTKPNASLLPSDVCFPTFSTQHISPTPDQMLSARTLQKYIKKIQSHPRWTQPKLASGQPSQQSDESFQSVLPQRKIHVRLHNATAPNRSLSKTISLLSATGTTSEGNHSDRSRSHDYGTAGILVQIEGVLQVLLTLAVRSAPDHAQIIVAQANVRGAFESSPMDPTSQGPSTVISSSQASTVAHLPSASPVYRAISADMMVYLTHEREADRRCRNNGDDATDDTSAAFRDLDRALMFVRALRTVEDHAVPAPPPLPPTSGAASAPSAPQHKDQTQDAARAEQMSKSQLGEPIWGFVGFFDPAAQDAQIEPPGADLSAQPPSQRSSGTWTSEAYLGQAPIRWAWCAPHATVSTTTSTTAAGTADGSKAEEHASRPRLGEWLAFNLGAASTAPVPMAEAQTNPNPLMGLIGPAWNSGTLGGGGHPGPAPNAPGPTTLLAGAFGGGSMGVMGTNFNAANMLAMSLPMGMPLSAPQAPGAGIVGLGTLPMQIMGGFS